MPRSPGARPISKDPNFNKPPFAFYPISMTLGGLSSTSTTRLYNKPNNPTGAESALTRFFRLERGKPGPELQREDTPEPEERVMAKGTGREAMSGQRAGSDVGGDHGAGHGGDKEAFYVSECVICWHPVLSTSQEQGDARTLHICSYADCGATTCVPCAAAWVEHQTRTQPHAYCPVCIRQFSPEGLHQLRQYSNPTWYKNSPSLFQQSEGPTEPPKHQSFRDAIAEFRASPEGRDLGPNDARRYIEWRSKKEGRTSGALENGMIERFWEWSFIPSGELDKPAAQGASSTPAQPPQEAQTELPRWWDSVHDRQSPAAQCVEVLSRNPKAKLILERLGEYIGAGADDGERQMIQERIKWVAFAYVQRQHDLQAGKSRRHASNTSRRHINIPRMASHHDLLWILSTIEPDDESLPSTAPISPMMQMPGRPETTAAAIPPPYASQPSPALAAPQGTPIELLGPSRPCIFGQPGGFQFSMDLLHGQTVGQAMTAYLHSLDRPAASPAVRGGAGLWIGPSLVPQDIEAARFEAQQGPLPTGLRLPDDVVRPVYSSLWVNRAPPAPYAQPLYNMHGTGSSSSSTTLVSLQSGSTGNSLTTNIATPKLPQYIPLADFRHSGVPEPPMPPFLKDALLRVIKRHKEEEDGEEDERAREEMRPAKVPRLMKSIESLRAGLKMKSKPKAKARDKGVKATDKCGKATTKGGKAKDKGKEKEEEKVKVKAEDEGKAKAEE
ncbi:hypothetical protein IAT38_004678 [Cryptococcus sp. DSM 104549]